MIIVDSTVWVDYVNGKTNEETRLLEARIGREQIGPRDIIFLKYCKVSEVKRSSRRSRRSYRNSPFPHWRHRNGGGNCDELSEIEDQGFYGSKDDCWIATFCLHEGHELLHRDRDFDPFESELGLRVVLV